MMKINNILHVLRNPYDKRHTEIRLVALFAADKIECMTDALKIIQEFNNLKNDADAYLHSVVEYALGDIDEKPKLEDYKLKN